MKGETMHGWARDLFPICRSITGPGVRETLAYIKNLLPNLQSYAVPSGAKAFDWTVPDEWSIRDAYLEHESGQRFAEFHNHNLHVVNYSEPVDFRLSLDELQSHLHSIPDQPSAIPYVTSYYHRNWGFCLAHDQRQSLPTGTYRAFIDSKLSPGVLNFGELVIPGESEEEVFLSTYICHPSLANNELSGPVVTTALAQWLDSLDQRRYTYRIVFIPETIGSLVYLSRNLKNLKKRVIAGFNISCVGDDRAYSFVPSRNGNTLSDRAAKYSLSKFDKDYVRYTWFDRGSDERQYCAPGVDLPIASILRTKYGAYPEYHTSLDDLEKVVTPSGLEGGFRAIQSAMVALEKNFRPVSRVLGEPNMGSRGLWPTMGSKNHVPLDTTLMIDLLSISDGTKDLIEMSSLMGESIEKLSEIAEILSNHQLLELLNPI